MAHKKYSLNLLNMTYFFNVFQVDSFILTYAVNERDSYENVFTKWAPELRRFAPKAKIILAGQLIKITTNCGSVSKINDPPFFGQLEKQYCATVESRECYIEIKKKFAIM